MPEIKRQEIPRLLQEIDQGNVAPLYLICGERFLCRNAADELIDRLLPAAQFSEHKRALHLREIDGDQEDPARTLSLLRSFSLFAGRQVIRVTDSKLLYSKGVAKTLWEKTVGAYAAKDMAGAGRLLRQFLAAAGLDPNEASAGELDSLDANRWQELFGFAKPQEDLRWTAEVAGLPQAAAGTSPGPGRGAGTNPAEQLIAAFTRGIPAGTVLILTSEAVDKRHKLYKFIRDKGWVIDLTVEGGAGAAARQDQEAILKELVKKTLAEFGKKLEPRALPTLLERVGFHPVAAVRETEKLCLFAGEGDTITTADVNAIIGRTREEALYELTEAFTRKRLSEALTILARLLENGIHALAILATIRNHFKKMLMVSTLQRLQEPAWRHGMSFAAFQKKYLPELKDGREQWATLWRGHPYGLYMLFGQTEKFTPALLQRGLQEVLTAEYRLKGSGVADRLVLENLFFNLLLEKCQEKGAS